MELYLADTLIDGTGEKPKTNVEILVDGGRIKEVVPAGSVPRPSDISVYSLPGSTVLPGFIDVHTHLMFGAGARSYEDVINNDSDDLMIIRGSRNAYLHLRAGVTMLRDCGARNKVTFAIREAANAGIILSPRIHISGRPLTITGGHFWWCNEEADGVDGVRAATRKLLKEGVDFIKIMASGGGTQGTDSTRASYTVEEMAAATFEAHQVGKKATAHTLAAESVERAVEAGLDQIEHFNFLHPDGSRIWDQVVADKIVQNGMVLSPTIQTGYRQIETLQNKAAAEDEILTELEEKQLAAGLYKLETKLEFIGRFKDMGAPIVAGTDAISVFGDYAVGLELFHRAGLSPMEVIISATSLAAKAIGVEDELGTVKPGMLADFIYLDGDPLENVQKLNNVETVVLNGKVVVDKRLDMAVGLPALADGDVKMSPIV